jgi:hypothetical protein
MFREDLNYALYLLLSLNFVRTGRQELCIVNTEKQSFMAQGLTP